MHLASFTIGMYLPIYSLATARRVLRVRYAKIDAGRQNVTSRRATSVASLLHKPKLTQRPIMETQSGRALANATRLLVS